MSQALDTSIQEFLRLYGQEAWKEWGRILAHFDLAEGFVFLVVLLPGAVGADICRRQLTARLAEKGKRLAELPCEWREDARRTADRVFALEPAEDLGGIWLGSVIPESDPEIESWKEAWRFGLGSLNQHRNPLLRRFRCPLVLVGAPWLNPLLRQAAPDLWSVRAAVVNVSARPEFPTSVQFGTNLIDLTGQADSVLARSEDGASDPDYALEQADRLRNKPGAEAMRAQLLQRAGAGFYARSRLDPAERTLREATVLFDSLSTNDPSVQPKLAKALHNLSIILSDLGRRDESLEKAQSALRIREQLAKAGTAQAAGELASSLGNLANRLSDVGRYGEALARCQEAVEIYRRLSRAEPHAFLPELAGLMSNLANKLSETGRHEEALKTAEEAVLLYEKLAAPRTGAFLPQLAAALNTVASIMREVGRKEEAVAKMRQAARISEQLSKARPDAFLPDWAASLNNLASMLRELGSTEEALVHMEDAVRVYDQLAQARPSSFVHHFAGSLNNLAGMLRQSGRREESLAKAEQAVAIYRRLARERPGVFLADLAMSLTTLSNALSEDHQDEQALTESQEAANIYGQLAKDRPGVFLPRLADSLNNLSSRQGRLGRAEEALENVHQAMRLWTQLSIERPNTFVRELAMAFGTQGGVLSQMGRYKEASASDAEGIRSLSVLFQKAPGAFAELMVNLFRDYVRSTQQAHMEPDMALLAPILPILEKMRKPVNQGTSPSDSESFKSANAESS